MWYTEAMEELENKINYQSEFLFNGEKSDTLIVFGFIFFSNGNEEIQCIDLVSHVILSPEYTKIFSNFNQRQNYVLKELGFGDYRNLIVKKNFDINLNKWPIVKIFDKQSKEIIKFENIDSKSKYYNYISRFDSFFSKYQYKNFKTFKNQIKLDVRNINLITSENMFIFEDEIKKALDFGIGTIARELFSKLDFLEDVGEARKKIDQLKKDVDQIVKNGINCANMEYILEIKNN